jgi:hypothetical protein
MFFVQRDEETCRKRCIDIQEVLAESMPATKKFSTIFGLMDRYTDEDSDVQLLTGVAIPKQGPVYIPAQTAVVAVPEPRDDSQVSEPSRYSAVAKSPTPRPSCWAAATIAPACEPRGTLATAPDKAAVIAKNKQAALDRRVQLQAAAGRDREQDIFEKQQWLPT